MDSAEAMKGSPLHLPYSNAIRTLAIAVGVFIHVEVWFMKRVPMYSPQWWLGNFVNVGNRWCVPALFMLSGALLLDPERRDTAREFYQKRLKRIGLPILFWTVFYILWRYWVLDVPTLNPKILLASLVFGSPSYHMWFMFALLGLYLFTPVLRSFWLKMTPKEQWTLTIFALGTSSLSALLWTYSGDMGWRIPPEPVITVEWVFYIGFYLLGYLVRDVKLTKKRVWMLAGLYVVMVIVNAFLYYYLSRIDEGYRAQGLVHNFFSPPVLVMSLAIFFVLQNVFSAKQPNKFSKFINSPILGATSFGVYLIHIAVIDVLTTVLEWNKLVGTSLGSFVLLMVVSMLSSYLLVVVLRRIPCVRNVFG